ALLRPGEVLQKGAQPQPRKDAAAFPRRGAAAGTRRSRARTRPKRAQPAGAQPTRAQPAGAQPPTPGASSEEAEGRGRRLRTLRVGDGGAATVA
ncbi:unnamed protein product, partial [Effrenium voratum]